MPATVTKLSAKLESGSRVLVTPDMAMRLLDANKLNRPLTGGHAERIAGQITQGKWRFNGDTIKISEEGDVLDGQHRLFAIIEAKTAVETIIVYGIKRDAFATIDTIRKTRSLGDTVALSGNLRHRQWIGGALAWLVRWQRRCIETYKTAKNRVENSDVENALADNPGIVRAVERACTVRSVANPALIGFLYYVVHGRNEQLADRMMATLADPSGIGVNDPFFRLRHYFITDHHKRKDALMSIAITIKAVNAAASGKKLQMIQWRNQGRAPEEFPKLEI